MQTKKNVNWTCSKHSQWRDIWRATPCSLLIFTFIAFAITQFGLMAVVKPGYAYLGYAALITLFIPFVLHALITRGREI